MGGRGTNLAQALQLALATAPPGHANRFVLLTDGRQNAGNALAVAQAAKDAGADIYYVPAPLTFKQEVVVESMVLPVGGEVRRALPGQGGGVEPGRHAGAPVALPERGVPRLPGRAPHRGQERLHVPTVARAERHPRLPGAHRGRGRHDRREQPLARHDRGARPAAPCCSPRRIAPRARRSPPPSASQHIDVELVEADRIPKDLAGLQKYDGDHPVQRLVAEDDQEADGEHPGLRPRPRAAGS